jgi:hypothetical protein
VYGFLLRLDPASLCSMVSAAADDLATAAAVVVVLLLAT